jgi:hypothetical protein
MMLRSWQIRKLSAHGVLKTTLAKQFTVSPETIRKIIRRETWKHVA